LGISKDATLEQIKEAYRNRAKLYHPDVNTSDKTYEPNDEKFKDVAEAYAVLSIEESKLAYDKMGVKHAENIYRAQRTEYVRKATTRDKSGNTEKEPHPSGSYAEEKQKWLAEERKKFNVDHIGRYKGGVPQKGAGNIRGKALWSPQEFHDPGEHNHYGNPEPDEQVITPDTALEFKHYMADDKYDLKKRWPWFEAEVDHEFFKFHLYRYGYRFFRNLFIVLVGLGFVVEATFKSLNRQALKFATEAAKHADLTKGIDYKGRKIVQTASGVIKYA